jgi:hypothetical protein
LCEAKILLFVDFFVCVSLGRLARVSFNGILRPRALYVWDRPFRLAASRVRCALFLEPASSGAGPRLSVVVSGWCFLSEAMVLEVVVE